MRLSSKLLLLGSLATLVACGDDDDDPLNPNNRGTMTATIDGQSFSGSAATGASYSGNVLGFGAVQASGNNSTLVVFVLNNVTGPGTYSLAAAANGIVTVTETSGTTTRSWNSSLTGGTGQVVITQLSGGRAVGTFTFSAPAATQSGATGTKVATNGQFNIEVTQ